MNDTTGNTNDPLAMLREREKRLAHRIAEKDAAHEQMMKADREEHAQLEAASRCWKASRCQNGRERRTRATA